MTGGQQPSGRFGSPIRTGLLAPYFSFFDQRFPPEYRPSQQRYAEDAAALLQAAGLQVTFSGLVDSVESAAVARKRFDEARVEVIVVAATMAAPPAYGLAALESFGGPIVVWDDRRVAHFDADLDEVDATRASSILGSIMLSSVLRRNGRPYVAVGTLPADPTEVVRAVRGAAAAAALQGATLGLIGGSLPGYDDVHLEPAAAVRLGIELVPISSAMVEAARSASAAATEDLEDLVDLGLRVDHSARPLVDRSLRVHRFLEALAAQAQVDALTINCHSDLIRWSDDFGVVGCLGASLVANSGVPVSCTGDAATSVALMLGARIAGSAQYCEGYAVEADTGELLLSSCGMADLRLAGPGDATVVPNHLYPGRHGEGCAVRFGFPAGPATIIAVGPQGGDQRPRLVFASGRLTGRSFERLNGPSGMFNLDSPGAGVASPAWIDAGTAHHVALVRGDLTTEIRVASAFLDVDLVPLGARA